ncbi:MAG: hypothetical protein LBG47_04425 [Prevotellaceae bacterium]|nr:hypothetical protein [Prevotellaceae bacterium]
MQTKSILFAAAAAFALTAALVACDKNKNENGKDSETEGGQTSTPIKVAETQAGDTLQIRYNGALDLSKIFSAAQPEDSTAKLRYVVERQPEFVEGDSADYTAVNAYSVRGDTLFAAPDVRVPDAVSAEGRLRVVREGKLKVLLAGVDSLTYTIKMTDKPALTPVISLGEGIEGLENGKLTLSTTGTPRLFTASYFTISPIDFGIEDIRVEIGSAGTGKYIDMSRSGAPQAGGLNRAAGTGGFVVAYHGDNTLEQALTDEKLPQARLYVDVELVAPTAVVGIELHPSIGQCNGASFWRNNANGRQPASNFVLMKLNNGTKRAYDGQTDSNLRFRAGDFDGYMEGRTSADTIVVHNIKTVWWTHTSLKAGDLPAVGTTVKFKVTSIAHFLDPKWTVEVETQTRSASPGTACSYSYVPE